MVGRVTSSSIGAGALYLDSLSIHERMKFEFGFKKKKKKIKLNQIPQSSLTLNTKGRERLLQK